MDFDASSDSPQPLPPSSSEPFASPRIVRLLATTQTWCYVLACIGFGYVALTALRLGVMISVGGRDVDTPVPVLVALAIAFVFYGLPSWMLLRYAQRIGQFRQSGDPGELLRVFAAQRHFWIVTSLAVIAVVAGMLLVIGVDVSRMMIGN